MRLGWAHPPRLHCREEEGPRKGYVRRRGTDTSAFCQDRMRSITNVLQEPLGWDFAACACLHRLSIHPTTDRGKLQSLIAHVTIEPDLFPPGAPPPFLLSA